MGLAAESMPEPPPIDLGAAYRAEFPYVWHSLRRLGVPERDLEDTAQEVFMTLFRRFGDYDPSRPMRPWLFGIAFRIARRFLDKAHIRREVLEEPRDIEDPDARSDQGLVDAEKRRLVARALATLDVDRRAVFILHDIDEQPVPEVAAALGIRLNTAYSRLRLARADFERAVRRLETGEGAL